MAPIFLACVQGTIICPSVNSLGDLAGEQAGILGADPNGCGVLQGFYPFLVLTDVLAVVQR